MLLGGSKSPSLQTQKVGKIVNMKANIFAMLISIWLVPLAAPGSSGKSYSPVIARLSAPIKHLKISPTGRLLAFLERDRLRILDLAEGTTIDFDQPEVSSCFFWLESMPDLVYRTLRDPVIRRFHYGNASTKTITKISADSSFLSNSNKLGMFAIAMTGEVRLFRIYYPTSIAAPRPTAQTPPGVWVVGSRKILWQPTDLFSEPRTIVPKAAIESFDISRDGTRITWSDEKGRVYSSTAADTPQFIDYGSDGRWHPKQDGVILYSSPRSRHNRDLKIFRDGRQKWLTYTPQHSERWPVWDPNHKRILYTLDSSTDLLELSHSGRTSRKEPNGNDPRKI